MNVANSTILITGGTSGIGLALVDQLTRQGATLIVTGRNLDALQQTKGRFPQVHIVQSDVSDPQAINRLYREVTHQFPALNMIINNAGLMRLIDLQDRRHGLDDIVREINTNLSGTIQMVHQFLPHLLTQQTAAIVNVSSAIAFMAYSAAPIYSASKAGVHAYTKALRLQLEETNVRVFELIPPGVKTNLQQTWALQPDPGQMMDADKLVSIAVKGILNDTWEITPGLVEVIKFASRIAPAFIERNLGHREFKKFKQLTQS